MYKVTYFTSRGIQTAYAVNGYSRAMEWAAKLATKPAAKPPFPIVILNEQGQVVQTIKG